VRGDVLYVSEYRSGGMVWYVSGAKSWNRMALAPWSGDNTGHSGWTAEQITGPEQVLESVS